MPLYEEDIALLQSKKIFFNSKFQGRTTAAYMINPKAASDSQLKIFSQYQYIFKLKYQYIFIKENFKVSWTYPLLFAWFESVFNS